jgi:hypothetical protein
VSSNPYQLGEFVAYDLNDIFNTPRKQYLSNTNLTIEKDDFQFSKAYQNYETYRALRAQVLGSIKNNEDVNPSNISKLQATNPEYWESYFIVGEYYYKKGYLIAALNAFEKAKAKEITTIPDKRKIDLYIKKLKRKLEL